MSHLNRKMKTRQILTCFLVLYVRFIHCYTSKRWTSRRTWTETTRWCLGIRAVSHQQKNASTLNAVKLKILSFLSPIPNTALIPLHVSQWEKTLRKTPELESTLNDIQHNIEIQERNRKKGDVVSQLLLKLHHARESNGKLRFKNAVLENKVLKLEKYITSSVLHATKYGLEHSNNQ